MANEAQLRDRLENPIDFTVADGTGIEKGTILKLTDPRTAIASTGAADKLAGIAAREKIASDGRTRLAVYRKGIFDLRCSGAVPVGEAVDSLGSYNYIRRAPVSSSGSSILGIALEDGSDAEFIQVFVNVGCGGNQIT